MKVVTSAEMREIDRRTSEQLFVPSLTLMENAGSAAAEFALSGYPTAKTFGIICGKGNNGGDGFVVARKLHEAGREVRLLLLADLTERLTDATLVNLPSLTEDELHDTVEQLHTLEGEMSERRRALHGVIDGIEADLAARHKVGHG